MKKILEITLKSLTSLLILLGLGGFIAGYFDRQNADYSKHRPNGLYEAYFKRPLDFICAGLALVAFSPLLVIIAILVRIKLGSPILFCQERPGLNEKIFKLYKFRSMTDEKDKDGNFLPDEIRLTKFGQFLRSTSIDELPELINILKGDMSIVGPRPLLVKYLPLYNEIQRHRHDVMPGLTGLAQVSGRNAISWEQKFEYDVDYTKHVSLCKDLSIIVLTVKKVFFKEGISAQNEATMPEFKGSNI